MTYPIKILALLAALAAACGNVASQDNPDGGGDNGGDGGISADATPSADARTHGTVTVTLRSPDGPVAETPVMYHAPDGSYLGSVLTNASGTATIENMPVGGLVTAPVRVVALNADNSLTTVADVQDGDHIVLGMAPSPEPGNLRVTIPSQYGNATSYQAATGCSTASFASAATTQSMSVSSRCADANGTFDVAAYAGSSADSADRLAYSVTTGALNAVSMPAWNANLGTHNVTLTGIPDGASAAVVAQGARGDMVIDPTASVSASNGATATFRLASGFYDGVVITASVSQQGAGQDVRGVFLRGITPPAGGATSATSINFSTDAFPPLNPTLELSTPMALSLSPARALTCRDDVGPDVILAAFAGATSEQVSYQWTMIQRGDLAGDGLTLPQLDPAIAAVRWPQAQFTVHQLYMYLIGSSGTDWDDYRADTAQMLSSLQAQDGDVTCVNIALVGAGD